MSEAKCGSRIARLRRFIRATMVNQLLDLVSHYGRGLQDDDPPSADAAKEFGLAIGNAVAVAAERVVKPLGDDQPLFGPRLP